MEAKRGASEHAGHDKGEPWWRWRAAAVGMGHAANSGVNRWLERFGEMREDAMELRARAIEQRCIDRDEFA